MGSSAPRDESCNLISGGLILWCVSMWGHADLWCVLFEGPEGFYFVVDEDPLAKKTYKVREEHPDIVSFLDRAEALKRSLLRCGWKEVDVA
jgi:hypothetical protein